MFECCVCEEMVTQTYFVIVQHPYRQISEKKFHGMFIVKINKTFMLCVWYILFLF